MLTVLQRYKLYKICLSEKYTNIQRSYSLILNKGMLKLNRPRDIVKVFPMKDIPYQSSLP